MFGSPVTGATPPAPGVSVSFNGLQASYDFPSAFAVPPRSTLSLSAQLNLQGLPAGTMLPVWVGRTPPNSIGVSPSGAIIGVVDPTSCMPAPQSIFNIEDLNASCPTAADVAAFNSALNIAFESDPSAPTLVCRASQGSADLTRLQERAYQALRLMRQVNLPLPWTDVPHYQWFINAVRGIRFRSDIQYSFCCDPAGVINIQTNNLGVLQFSSPEWLMSLMVLFMHEARHNQNHPHTCGSNDQTLQELGAWGVQFHTNAALMLYSGLFLTPKNLSLPPTFYREWAWSEAQSVLNSRICDLTAEVVASPASLEFADQIVGTQSQNKVLALTVANQMGTSLSTYTMGGANPGDFIVSSAGCGPPTPPVCTLLVGFRPSAAGRRTATLSLSNLLGPLTVPFSGNGSSTPVPSAVRYVPITPCRLMDTRPGQGTGGSFGPPIVGGGTTRDVPVVQGACGLPAEARAYALNVTVVPPGPLGYLSIWPAGQARPLVSTLNSFDGRVVANAAIVPAGANGAISLFASNDTHVILDVNGYFAPYTPFSGMPFLPIFPCRAVDTRPGQGTSGVFGPPAMAAGSTRDYPALTGPCGVPVAPRGYSLNATVVPQGPLGYLSLWPSGTPQPVVSTLNSFDGRVVANAAILPSSPSGGISAFVTNTTDLILDVNGVFIQPGGNGLSFYPLPPCRIVDTREGQGKTGAFGPPSLAAAAMRDFPLPQGGCGVPLTAAAFSLNVTVVPQGPLGFLTLWPSVSGLARPGVSTLNSFDGAVVANAAIVVAGNFGNVSVYASHPTDVIIDVNGYFAP